MESKTSNSVRGPITPYNIRERWDEPIAEWVDDSGTRTPILTVGEAHRALEEKAEIDMKKKEKA